jgi:hypothetical protein
METAMTRDYIDTFVIASGDSDFLPLISKLRELNRYVVVIARKDNASSLFAKCCDELLLYDTPSVAEPKPKGNLTHAQELVTRALKHLSEESIDASLSRVKGQIKDYEQSFSEADFGFSQFKLFLQYFEKKGVLTLTSLPLGEYRVELRETSVAGKDSKVVKSEKTSAQSEIPAIVSLPVELLDYVAWACRYKLKENENTISLSILSSVTRKLFPDFKLGSYGFPREGGWRKLASIMEQDRWCDLTCDAKTNQFMVALTPDFLARSVAMPEPSNFAELLSESETRFSPESLQKSTVPASLTTEIV